MDFNDRKNGASNDETPGLPPLIALQENATDDEQVAYIRAHHNAMIACRERGLKHAWLAGRALEAARAHFEGNEESWDAFCQEMFGIRARQAGNLRRVARELPSLDDLNDLPPECSINGAIRIIQDRNRRKEVEKGAERLATTPPPSDLSGDTNELDGGARNGRSDHDATTVAEPQAPQSDRRNTQGI